MSVLNSSNEGMDEAVVETNIMPVKITILVGSETVLLSVD